MGQEGGGEGDSVVRAPPVMPIPPAHGTISSNGMVAGFCRAGKMRAFFHGNPASRRREAELSAGFQRFFLFEV